MRSPRDSNYQETIAEQTAANTANIAALAKDMGELAEAVKRLVEKREWNWQTVAAIGGLMAGVWYLNKDYVDTSARFSTLRADGDIKYAALQADVFRTQIEMTRGIIADLQDKAVVSKERLEALEQKSAMRYNAMEAKADFLQVLIAMDFQKQFGIPLPPPFLPTRGPTSDLIRRDQP